MKNVDQFVSALSAASDAAKSDKQREAEAKAEAARAERIAKNEAKNPGLVARNAVLDALKSSLADDAQDAIEHGASPRTELALTAKHSRQGAAIMGALGQTARGAFYATQAELADHADQSASSLSFLRGIPVLQALARTPVTQTTALMHQQTKLIGRLNRSGDDLAKTLHAIGKSIAE